MYHCSVGQSTAFGQDHEFEMSPTSRFDALPEARGIVIQQVPPVADREEEAEADDDTFDEALRDELNYIHNHCADPVTLDLSINAAMPPLLLTQDQQTQSSINTGYYAKQNLHLHNSSNKLRTQLVASKYLQK